MLNTLRQTEGDKLSDFKYSYEKLFGNKSQCERCHNESCPDIGKHSHYDGKTDSCSRFQELSKERMAEIEREKMQNKQRDDLDKASEYWETIRKQYSLYDEDYDD